MIRHIEDRDVLINAPADHAGDLSDRLSDAYGQLRGELGKVVVGQEQVIEELLIAMLCGGHCILEGVPGLAKTLMISTLAKSLNLSFSRIQFTPDLMPSDITGTEVIEEDHASGARTMRFVRGPVFANVVLADEINRTPPKTQSALLEAMQEKQVSAGGRTEALPLPFFVLATQNPIEHEGTYPLPEAQLDRFMFKVLVDYPSEEEELAIVKRTTSPGNDMVTPVLSQDELLELQRLTLSVPCAETVMRYAMRLARWTRSDDPHAPTFVREFVSWGAGPRASQSLVMASKARALLNGRSNVSMADIEAVAQPVLRHRIITNFNADAEGVTPDQIIDRLLNEVPREDVAGLDAAGVRPVLTTVR